MFQLKKELSIYQPGHLLELFGKEVRTPCDIDVSKESDIDIQAKMKFYGIEDYNIVYRIN